MRDIKFRAYDKLNKKFICLDDFCIEGTGCYGNIMHNCPDYNDDMIEWESTGYELMQFTGLKDKNDKDIYEGDIVSWTQPDNGEVDSGTIIWNKEYAGFEITGDHCLDWNHMLTIIGNIHENPELIKELKDNDPSM